MGKAKIISGGPAGKYNIELVKETARITANIAAINTRLPLLIKAITDAKKAQDDAEADLIVKQGALNTAIGKLILKQMTSEQVSGVQKAYLTALGTYETKRVAYSLLLQEQESKTKEKTLLEKALVTEYRNDVWCADLTEDIAAGTEVDTIEVNGESSKTIAPIIYPDLQIDNLPESKLQPTQSSTPSGVFYNLAILPGWQRWKPTYRIGTITSISGDLCNVRLDTARSTAEANNYDGQKLNINPLVAGGAALVLSNVPIEYMDGLNGSVFVVGDRVVIEFTAQLWAAPKVIGFETNPRGGYGNYLITDFEGVNGSTAWLENHPLLPDLIRYNPSIQDPQIQPVYLTNTDKKYGETSLNFSYTGGLQKGLLWQWAPVPVHDFTLEMWVQFKGVWPSFDEQNMGLGRWLAIKLGNPITTDNFRLCTGNRYGNEELVTWWYGWDGNTRYIDTDNDYFEFTRNEWQHLAFICKDNNFKAALKGNILHSWNASVNHPFSNCTFLSFILATWGNYTDSFLVDGLIFSNKAKWTGNFIPPTTFPHIELDE